MYEAEESLILSLFHCVYNAKMDMHKELLQVYSAES